METLPRILHARAYRPDVTFVSSAFVEPRYLALLEAWNINVVVVASGSVIKSSEVILVDQPQLFWPRRVDVDAVRREFACDNSPAPKAERIYVSRKNVSRALRDEEVLQAALLELGVRSVVLEELSFVEQVKLFRGTSLVVASHGAGLVGIAFMGQGARVVEITSGEVFEECYRRLAAIRGFDYTCVQISGSLDAPQGEAGGVIEQLVPLGL
jgi:capsular polysaccharide biosynthesis protein